MQSDDPPFLAVGTEVSARFKGAFCEAKVKKVQKVVKCKVALRESPFGSIMIEDTQIKTGNLAMNEIVEVQHGKALLKAQIQSIKDCSTYHVVFNDGDEKTVRRTWMCLKGAKHFDSAVNLDALPLYNPEQFSSPVVKSVLGKDKKGKKRKVDESPSKRKRRKEEDDDSEDEQGKKREKRAAASAATVAIEEMDQGDTEASCDGSLSGDGDASDAEKEKEKEREKRKKEDEKEKRDKEKPSTSKADKKFSPGDVVCVFEENTCKGKWFPAVVVSVKAYKKSPKARTLTSKDWPLRSFQNGKYLTSLANFLTLFENQSLTRKVLDNMGSAMRAAVERAQAYISKGTLPNHWDKQDILGEDEKPSPKSKKEKAEPRAERSDRLKEKEREKEKAKEKKEREKEEKEKEKEAERERKQREKSKPPPESESSSSSSGEEEYGEERDLFVAQLYKFQEERGTPINRAPVLGGKDIDLYRFYRVVQHYGGAKRVTTNSSWKKVQKRLGLDGCAGATPVTVRKAYARYLSHFNSFYKRLGWSLDELSSTSTVNSPRERRLVRTAYEDKSKLKRRKSTGDAKKKDDDEKSKESDRESCVDVKDVKPEKEKGKKEEKEKEKPEKEQKKPVERKEKEKTNDKKEKKKEDEKEKIEKEKSEKADKKEKEEVEEEMKVDKSSEKIENEKVKEEPELKKEDKEKKRDEKDEKKDKKKEKEKKDEKIEVEVKPEKEKVPEKEKEKEKDKTKDKEEDKKTDKEEDKEKKDKEPKMLEKKKDKDKKDKEKEKEREKIEKESGDEAPERRKDKRKPSISRSSGKGDLTDPVKDPNEGYSQADIFSHFYLGQKVRAQHHGRWYDARVVSVTQTAVKELVDLILKAKQHWNDSKQPIPANVLEQFHKILETVKCFVHYLGWNSRYDESIPLNKIRISLKDQQSSLNMARSASDGRIPENVFNWVLKWSSGPEGVESLQKAEEPQPSPNFLTMGSYRPRRVSISHLEQLSAESARREREAKKGLGSPPPHFTRAPTVTPPIATKDEDKRERRESKSKEDVRRENIKSPVSSPVPNSVNDAEAKAPEVVAKSPVRESRRLRTSSLSKERPSPATTPMSTASSASMKPSSPVKRETATPASTLTPASTPAPVSIPSIDDEQEHSPELETEPIILPVRSPPSTSETVPDDDIKEEPEKALETESETNVVSGVEVDLRICSTSVAVVETVDDADKLIKEEVTIEEVIEEVVLESEPVSIEETETPSTSTATDVPPLVPAASITVAATENGVANDTTAKEPLSKKKRVVSDVDRQEEQELLLEEEAKALCSRKHDEDTLSEASGSVTPLRVDEHDDADDGDKWSCHGEGSPRMTSPSRGRGMKRKRVTHSRHSHMVVDRKYVKHKGTQKEREEQSDNDDDEEDGSKHRARYMTLRHSVHKTLEAEGTLDDISILGLDPMPDEKQLTEEELVAVLEERIRVLRDVYASSKSYVLNELRRRRDLFEKRRERARSLMSSPSTTATSGSST